MMKKTISIIIIAVMLVSCAIIKQNNTIIGEFKGKTPSAGSFVPVGEMSLTLLGGGAFELNWLNVDYSGKWELSGENSVIIFFDELTDPMLYLRSGVILDTEKELKFISKNKIQFNNWVLKRIK